jgi:Meckel syndrome type 1 protein
VLLKQSQEGAASAQRAATGTQTLARSVAPPPPPSPPAPTPDIGTDPKTTAAGKAQMEQAADSAQRSANRDERYAAPAPPAALADAEARAAAMAERTAIAEDSRLPPNQWLQRIRKHRFEGDSALARASLRAFQQAHPDATIPEDLRPLLP